VILSAEAMRVLWGWKNAGATLLGRSVYVESGSEDLGICVLREVDEGRIVLSEQGLTPEFKTGIARTWEFKLERARFSSAEDENVPHVPSHLSIKALGIRFPGGSRLFLEEVRQK